VRESRINYDLSRKKHSYVFTEAKVEIQEAMSVQKGMRDKTGHIPREAPPKGSFAERRKQELKEDRERYNVNFLGFYNGGIPVKNLENRRQSNKGKSMAMPGEFHHPRNANFVDNYNPDATFVDSEDAIKFKAWMRTDKEQFDISRPYYKTYYDYNEQFFAERSYHLMCLLALYLGHYAYKRWDVENARWRKHDRKMQVDKPAHHYHNRGGVVLEKEFVGFNKYYLDEANQMEWLRAAYPEIYKEAK